MSDGMMRVYFSADRKQKVVIAGNGLAGVAAGKEFERLLKGNRESPFEVTILGRSETYTFKPLLPDLVNGAPATVPMRDIFTSGSPVQFKQAEILGVSTHPSARAVKTSVGDVPYDKLVLALGNTSRNFILPGSDKYAIPFDDQTNVAQILDSMRAKLKAAAALPAGSAEQKKRLSFVIIGAGLSGIELSFTMRTFAKEFLRQHYPFRADLKPFISLIQALPDILAEAPARDRNYVKRRLAQEGIQVFYHHKVTAIHAESIELLNAQQQKITMPVIAPICALGGFPNRALDSVPLPRDKNSRRFDVNEYLEAKDNPGIFVIGDLAAAKNPGQKDVLPTEGQVAEQAGRYIARHIINRQAGKPVTPFRYRERGKFYSTGEEARAWIHPLPVPLGYKLGAWIRKWAYQDKLKKLVRE